MFYYMCFIIKLKILSQSKSSFSPLDKLEDKNVKFSAI